MIGLDTNLLIRLLTGDNPAQARKVDRLLEEKCTPNDPGFVTSITLAELVWTLKSRYEYPKNEIIVALETVMRSKDLLVENEAETTRALNLYINNSCDFSDALIGEISKSHGTTTTKTFDKRASKLDTFSLL